MMGFSQNLGGGIRIRKGVKMAYLGEEVARKERVDHRVVIGL